MTLIEIEGFLRGKCLPGDILVGETNAQYLLRKLNAVTELQRQLTSYEATVTNLEAEAKTLKAGVKHLGQKVHGLAADNSRLNDVAKGGAFVMQKALMKYEFGIGMTEQAEHFIRDTCEKFEATDAELAEIRAQGVDAFAADLGNAYQQLRAGSPQAKALKAVVFRAASFSEQLRKKQGK